MLNIRKLGLLSLLFMGTATSLMGMPDNSEPGPGSKFSSQSLKKGQPKDLRDVSQGKKQSAKKTMGDIIRKKQAQQKHEKEKLESEEQKAKERIQKENAKRLQRSQSSTPAGTPITFDQPKEEKFKIVERKPKEKTKGRPGLDKVQENKNVQKVKKVPEDLPALGEEKKSEVQVSKGIYSENAEKLSGGAKKILDYLFLPYEGEIMWKKLSLKKNEIETLLNSAGFTLEADGTGHSKVMKNGQTNHLLAIPFHGQDIKKPGTYLKRLARLLIVEGFYPLEFEEKLKDILEPSKEEVNSQHMEKKRR